MTRDEIVAALSRLVPPPTTWAAHVASDILAAIAASDRYDRPPGLLPGADGGVAIGMQERAVILHVCGDGSVLLDIGVGRYAPMAVPALLDAIAAGL